VYVTPEWVQSVIDGNQEGYDDYVIAEATYGAMGDSEGYNKEHVIGSLYVDICEVEDATGDEKGAYNLLAPDEVRDDMLAHGITKDTKNKLSQNDNFKLVSIRNEAEWLGETSGYSYMDKAGEPEGAVWGKGADTAFDVNQFTNDDGTVINLDKMKEVWKDCDFTLDNDLAFYCGTGWRATVPFLVLYENGYDNIAVYDGGWYEWLMHDDNLVQVGDPTSEDCEHTTVAKLPTGKAALD
jgi:Rhodanese-related sulfurtransferase